MTVNNDTYFRILSFIDKADVLTGLQGIRDLWKKSDTVMQIQHIRSARRQKDKKININTFLEL